MPMMTNRQSVAANTVVDNVFSGQLHEFINTNAALVTAYATASAVGLRFSLIIGGVTFIDRQEVNAQNRMPVIPDDVLSQGAGVRGDRVVVRLENTTAGAITAFSRVDVDPRG